ncbi:hypothetical protein [Microtetraspora sp. NBRC 13810]|uniref:hypothetical protein n=1 Tax=Microtetraspora sp. NBRC 13810 TaxID=3030990 RepID=UPI0025545231|nr:hypothetical protein [Microtetraspora sp. NBRC 13810]
MDTTLTRLSYTAGPALLMAYGIIRLLDGLDGTRGPGLAWTAGHVAFLIGALLLGAACVGLRRLAGPRAGLRGIAADLGLAAGLLGALATAVQAAVDVYAGLAAADRAGMGEIFDQVQSYPGVMLAVYTVGPALLFAGPIVLGGVLAAGSPRLLPVWSPVMMVVGTVLAATDLDRLPLGAACFWLAFVPAAAAYRPSRAAIPSSR